MEIILSIAASLMMAKVSFNWFFEDTEDFWDTAKLWVTPDIIEVMRGGAGSLWAELKIWAWLGLAVLTGAAVYKFLIS